MTRGRNILLLGSRSDFTATVLSHLARARVADLHVVAMPRARSPRSFDESSSHPLAIDIPDPLAQKAAEYEVRVDTLGALSDIPSFGEPPDLIVTACFPSRLPAEILHYPRAGCLNVHPSLLPAYRGPSPVFWQLRAGDAAGGVTVHKLDDALDAGDIVAARSHAIPAGVTAAHLLGELVDSGSRLLVEALTAHDWKRLPRVPQDDSSASYYGWPAQADFRMDVRWSAERAYRFMRGTAAWGQPYPVAAGGVRLALERAIAFDASGKLPIAWEREGNDLLIAFEPGVLRATGHEQSTRPDNRPRRDAGPG